MKTALLLMMLWVATAVGQTNLHTCLLYMTTNYPGSSWEVCNDSDGKGPYIAGWVSGLPQPTLVSAYSNWPAASMWRSNVMNSIKCNFEAWDKRELKALVLVLMDEINILRAKHALPARTSAQFKTAIRSKL